MKNFIMRRLLIMHYKFPSISKIFQFFVHNSIYIFENLTTNKSEYMKNIFEGEKKLEKLTKDKNYYYLLSNTGLGDTMIVASFAKYIKEKYNKDIAFISLKNHASILNDFEFVSKIIPCSRDDYDKIFLYISYTNIYETKLYKYCFFKMKVSKKGTRNWYTSNLPYKMSLSDKYKKYVFNLSDNLKMNQLVIKNDKEKIKKICDENNINFNSILIIPYAYSTSNLDLCVWEKIVEYCNVLGYKVFTNIGNPKKEKIIKGTKELCLPMNEVLYVCDKFKFIISNRCGFAEYLANNNPNMILIDEWEKYPSGWDDVNIYSSKKTIKYVYRDRKSNDKIAEEIIDLIGEKK